MCSHGYYHDVGGGDLLSPSCASLLHSLKVASVNILYVASHYRRPTNLHNYTAMVQSHFKSTLGDQAYPGKDDMSYLLMQARLIHVAASLCIYALHIILAFKILHPVLEKLFIPCTPVSLVLNRNWYQLLADFQAMLPWQRQWKAFRRKKNDIVSWNHLGAHFTNFPACILNSWSARLLVMFLTSSTRGCTWPLNVPLSGWLSEGVLVLSTFLYFYRGLFDMQHCCSVIMPGLWLTWRLALSKKKLQWGNQSAWKVPPIYSSF